MKTDFSIVPLHLLLHISGILSLQNEHDFYQNQSFPALQPGTLPVSSGYDLLYIIRDTGL